MPRTSKFIASVMVMILFAGGAMAQIPRLESTPHLEQIGFGPHGEYLPNDGLEYCVPTSFTMALYWLRANGMPRVAPKLTEDNALATDLALAGLFNTSPDGGTNPSSPPHLPAVATYLALKGIGGVNVRQIGKPTFADIQKAVTGLNMGVINIGWVSLETLERTNGHNVTIVATDIDAQGQAAPGTVAINNPMVAQTEFVPTVTLQNMMNPALNGYLAFTGGVLGNPNKVIPVIENVTVLEPDSFAQPLVSFRPSRSVQLAATGGSMSVWAPIVGPKGLTKLGAGDVVLERTSRSTYRGRTQIFDGSLVTRIPNGQALGRGDIRLLGGSLVIAPDGTGVARPILGAGARDFRFTAGTLEIRQGATRRVAAEIAGRFLRGPAGSLLIAPSRGLDALGNTEMLTLREGLPPDLRDFHGIVAPIILGEQSGASGAGDFLEYDAVHGFVRAGLAGVGAGIGALSSRFPVAAGQVLGVHALRLDDALVHGGGTLRLWASDTPDVAALILNGSAVETRRLQLDARENVIYASREDGRISAEIDGRGGLVVVGPGRLHLSGSNAYKGGTVLNGATLVVENAAGSATGGGDVAIGPDACVAGAGRIGGSVKVAGAMQPGGVLAIDGDAFFEGRSQLTWELADLSDTPADAGTRWTVLEVRRDLVFDGNNNQFQTLVMKFPAGKGPNRNRAFWRSPHQWVIARAGGMLDATGLAVASPRYNSGQFSIRAGARSLQLIYTPAAPQ